MTERLVHSPLSPQRFRQPPLPTNLLPYCHLHLHDTTRPRLHHHRRSFFSALLLLSRWRPRFPRLPLAPGPGLLLLRLADLVSHLSSSSSLRRLLLLACPPKVAVAARLRLSPACPFDLIPGPHFHQGCSLTPSLPPYRSRPTTSSCGHRSRRRRLRLLLPLCDRGRLIQRLTPTGLPSSHLDPTTADVPTACHLPHHHQHHPLLTGHNHRPDSSCRLPLVVGDCSPPRRHHDELRRWHGLCRVRRRRRI